MAPRLFTGLVGAALFIVGLVLFIVPVSVTVAGETGTCASSAPFGGVPTDLLLNNQASEDFTDSCADEKGTRQAWSWGLVGVGAVVVLGCLAVRRPAIATQIPQRGNSDPSTTQ
ncbi:hypothetical protein DMP23_23895 [Amycolatopsis sp. A1MSW2902]|uniref:hypothetical protein n=1 Tax=Amycolatopsis sp. A1MSW2902 TaxID=687413 RepID=UPI00307FAA84